MSTSKFQKILSITKRLSLLYVEDNDEARQQMYKMLENFFPDIKIAEDGKKALELFESYHEDTNTFFDLVMTDIRMPELDGIELSKKIYEMNPKQPIIVLSAYNDTKYLVDLINLGVEGFMQKPVSLEHLISALESFCQKVEQNAVIELANECSFDVFKKLFTHKNMEIALNEKEIKLLECLASHLNGCSQKELFHYVFYDEPLKDFTSDVIKGLIKRLRKKIPEDVIQSSRNKGYWLNII